MSTKITKEVIDSKNGQCKIGLEVNFKEDVGCDMEREKRNDDKSNEVKMKRREIHLIETTSGRRRRRRRSLKGWK